jgi:hypothetical protein
MRETKLGGIVEVDQTFIGGKAKWKMHLRSSSPKSRQMVKLDWSDRLVKIINGKMISFGPSIDGHGVISCCVP